MERKEYDILLVGAGLFNAVMAVQLANRGKRVLVIEKRKYVGGNCYTYLDNGIIIHAHGAHIFHTSDPEVWAFANKYDRFVPFVNSPVAMVNEDGKWVSYNLPFNMNTFSKLWGYVTPDAIQLKLDDEKSNYELPEYKNLEEKALGLVGPTIFNKFIKGYTEKQWGRSCTELSPDIITRIPVRFTYDNNYFNDIWQGIPEHGYTSWIANMLANVEVRLGVDYLKDREYFDNLAEDVVYSGKIDEFFNYSHGKLPYRSLQFDIKTRETDNYQGVAVVNYPGKEVPYTRVIEHRHFMRPEAQKDIPRDFTVISKETPVEMSEEREAYYPIVNPESKKLYDTYMAMRPKNVYFAGRLGMFSYNDMDDTISKALEMSESF